MNILEFEQRVWEVEEILIRIRAPSNHQIQDYDFTRKARHDMSVTNWVNGRLRPRLEGLELSIIDGNFARPHGKTQLRTVRESYVRNNS